MLNNQIVFDKYEGKTGMLSVILEGSNKGAKIALLKIIVSYVLNTGSNRI